MECHFRYHIMGKEQTTIYGMCPKRDGSQVEERIQIQTRDTQDNIVEYHTINQA